MAIETAATETKTFTGSCLLRVVEIWQPSEDGTRLELISSACRDCEPFEAASEDLTYSVGEGLPGAVFQRGLPIVFEALSSIEFVRSQVAEESGLAHGLGLPVLIGEEIVAVVLFLFSGGEEATGAMESWVVDPARRELGLELGCYLQLPLFEKTSRRIKWPFGAGLPGITWRTAMPQLLDDLAESDTFIRGADAGESGLQTALSIPIATSAHGFRGVLLLLSATRSPLFRSILIWQPDHVENTLVLKRVSSVDFSPAEIQRLLDREQPITLDQEAGINSLVWSSSFPQLGDPTDDDPDAIASLAEKYGLRGALALPITVGQNVTAVVTLMF